MLRKRYVALTPEEWAHLERYGLNVLVVGDGQQALKLLQEDSFDLVLLDCQMPVLDGFATCRAWREFEQASGRPRLPVLAFLTATDAEDRQRCLAAGMDDYLAKPYRGADIHAVLALVASGAPGAAGADAGGRPAAGRARARRVGSDRPRGFCPDTQMAPAVRAVDRAVDRCLSARGGEQLWQDYLAACERGV